MASDPAGAPATFGREPPPPVWDGSEPGLLFAVYEKNVKLWQFETELDTKKQGVRLLRGLTGVARAAADSLEFEQIADEKGVQNILQVLKGHFAPHLEVSLPRAFERAVYGPPRSHKEDIQEYLIRCERAFHLLSKEGVSLPDAAVGYVIYRQAALSESQELRFGAWAGGKYDKATVLSCLRKLDKVVSSEKGKSSVAYVQEDGDAEGHEAEEYDDGEDGEEQYVFLDEGDMDRIFEEPEIQVVLASYQEVRKAIQNKQKGRQFFKGGKGRGSPWQNFTKGKQRVHVEQLKLRTRCARCGAIGHWARECRAPEDQRGRLASAAMSSKTSGSSAPSTTSGGQQSWYVASEPSGTSSFCCLSFSFECRGNDTQSVSESKCSRNACWECRNEVGSQDSSLGCDVRDSLDVFVGSNLAFCQSDQSGSHHYFVGLTTCPTMALVDTAAQDGLVGRDALQRLSQKLQSFGLRVKWTDKKAKAHGVGGQAEVHGIAAIPLGLAGSSGVLEVTVVSGDVPLLLPIRMLKELQAVIDLESSRMTLKRLRQSVELHTMPSGHVAVDILNFGPEGFSFPQQARDVGYAEHDFRCDGSSGSSCVMLTHLQSLATSFNHGGSFSAVPPCLQPEPWRCYDGKWGYGEYAPQPQEGNGTLEAIAGQGFSCADLGWAGGVSEFVASVRCDGSASFVSNILKAVGQS